MVIKKLRDYLDSHHVKYVVVSHSKAYSAQQIAELTHIPGKEMAKTVIVNIHGKMAMMVLPASYHINFQRLAEAMGTGDLYLATEDEFISLFPDCEVGAMPPLGNLYNMDTYVAYSLTLDKEIAFNAGTHTDLIKMSYADFDNLVEPKTLSFTTRKD